MKTTARLAAPLALTVLLSGVAAAAAAAPTLVRFKRVQPSDKFYAEGADAADFNGDGHGDITSGPFWYAGPDFKARHAIRPAREFNPKGYSDAFFNFADDIDADSDPDILIVGFPGKEAYWYENPGADKAAAGHWAQHLALKVVDNESPHYTDLTGDGRAELVCSQGGVFGYGGPDRADPQKPWVFRKISGRATGGKFTHGLGVGDVNGDGRADLLERAGWWEQPASLEGDPPWRHHPVAFCGGGAQIVAYDFDGDGDSDVLTSLNPHAYGFAWHEQRRGEDGAINFHRHLIMGAKAEENPYGVVFSQHHAITLADLDGDGVEDVITGKRFWAHNGNDPGGNDPAVLYWFRTARVGGGGGKSGAVEFVPFKIDDDSGVGTQVEARDLDGNGVPDIVVGNKKGVTVHLAERVEVDRATFDAAQPKKLAAAPQPAPVRAGVPAVEAAAAMTVPPGFAVTLVAGEPRLRQPVALAIDHRGRVWVAEAHTYPRRAPEGEGRDNILIFEDADGDGAFETRKVFAQNLNLVSGLEVGFGGVWVGAAPYLLFIPDRDGDDQPDGPPEVLLDGWGYQDTHETLNTFIWGPDGWLYGCHGVFTHSRVGVPGTPDADRTPLNAGVWRYHPVRHQFEVFAHGTSNPWGVDFDDHGQAFLTACVIPHLFHMVQGGRYQRQGGRHFNPHTYDDIKTIADHAHYAGSIREHAHWGHTPLINQKVSDAGGGHAHCGAMVYLGGRWPKEYRNTVFFNNIHGNRINCDIPVAEGSGYIGTHGEDFLFANDQWFRGINLRYGPDGNAFLIDWHDERACHRTSPGWNRSNGRLFKISYHGDAPAAVFEVPKKIDLARLPAVELARLQLHPNDWWVRTARRVLQERAATGTDLAPAVAELRRILADHEDPTRRLRALWALHVVGALKQEDFVAPLSADKDDARPAQHPGDHAPARAGALQDPDPHVAAWAVQLWAEEGEGFDFSEITRRDFLARSPVIRRYVASAMQRRPVHARWTFAEALAAFAEDADDPNIPLLIWYGIEPAVPGNPPSAEVLARLNDKVRSGQIPLVARFVARRLAGAGPAGLAAALKAASGSTDAKRTAIILEEIVNALRDRATVPQPDVWDGLYARYSASPEADVRRAAEELAVKFGDRAIFPRLRETLADLRRPAEDRRRALGILLDATDPGTLPVLQKLAARPGPGLQSDVLRALAAYDDPATPAAILRRYPDLPAEARHEAINTLTSRAPYALALLDAVESGRVPRADLGAFAVRQITQLPGEKLARRLTEVWGQVRATTAGAAEEIKRYKAALGPEVLARADTSRGRALYDKTCATCHRLFGQGGEIGPDLTGSNRSDLDYLLSNILDPSAVLGRDYQLTSVKTNDGRLIAGMVAAETPNAITLRTLTGSEIVRRGDIASRETAPVSMMPPGLLAALQPDEVRDLVAYLASRAQVPLPGRSLQIDPATGRVPGALEGEDLTVLAKTGNPRPQDMGGFKGGRWSGNRHLWWTGAKPGDELRLRLPVARPGRYEVFSVLTKAPDYGIVQLALDGTDAGRVDLYDPAVVTTGVISLGTHDLQGTEHTLSVKVAGANPKAAKAYMFGLDFLRLLPAGPEGE